MYNGYVLSYENYLTFAGNRTNGPCLHFNKRIVVSNDDEQFLFIDHSKFKNLEQFSVNFLYEYDNADQTQDTTGRAVLLRVVFFNTQRDNNSVYDKNYSIEHTVGNEYTRSSGVDSWNDEGPIDFVRFKRRDSEQLAYVDIHLICQLSDGPVTQQGDNQVFSTKWNIKSISLTGGSVLPIYHGKSFVQQALQGPVNFAWVKNFHENNWRIDKRPLASALIIAPCFHLRALASTTYDSNTSSYKFSTTRVYIRRWNRSTSSWDLAFSHNRDFPFVSDITSTSETNAVGARVYTTTGVSQNEENFSYNLEYGFPVTVDATFNDSYNLGGIDYIHHSAGHTYQAEHRLDTSFNGIEVFHVHLIGYNESKYKEVENSKIEDLGPITYFRLKVGDLSLLSEEQYNNIMKENTFNPSQGYMLNPIVIPNVTAEEVNNLDIASLLAGNGFKTLDGSPLSDNFIKNYKNPDSYYSELATCEPDSL